MECPAKVLKHVFKRTRLEPKIINCLFIEYVQNNAAYRFLVLRDNRHSFEEDTIIEFKNAEFFLNIFFLRKLK